MMGRMAFAHAAAARHFCRKDGCPFTVEPQDDAHQQVVTHRRVVHGLTTAKTCHAECGYRARPFEGRYTVNV